MRKKSIKETVFLTSVSRAAPATKSLRSVIPYDLLTKMKLNMGDKLCWQLGDGGRVVVWKRKKSDRFLADKKVIDITPPKEVVTTPLTKGKTAPVKQLTTTNEEPQITGTAHV